MDVIPFDPIDSARGSVSRTDSFYYFSA